VYNGLTPAQNELEASLALSRPPASHPHIPSSRRAISLTLLTRTRNPSQLARALYLSPASTRHAFLSGAPAEDLGGLPLVDPSYFYTSARWREHRRGMGLPEDERPESGESEDADADEGLLDMMPMGTVGAVALDVRGCIVACTSTGGRTNKLPGRVGDTPHNGAGFWAEEWPARRQWWRRWVPNQRWSKVRAVGVSGTGDGDVRLVPAMIESVRANILHFCARHRYDSTLFVRIRQRRWHTGCNTLMSQCIRLHSRPSRRYARRRG
jgi:L-asparaginase / beta-aspartyl-peptidase